MNIDQINFDLLDLKPPILIIIGPPGAGKTVVGKQLADELGWSFYDTDALIENATALKIAEIFSNHGEQTFRQLENSLVKNIAKLCESNQYNTKSIGGTIMSCGGGLPIAPENFANLTKSGKMLCLQAPVSVLLERVSHVKTRPLLNSTTPIKAQANDNSEQLLRLATLITEREAIYAKADYKIDTANLSIQEVVTTIRKLLKL